MALTEKLGNIADAIREKTGSTELLSLDGMAAAIAGITAGGGGLAYDMGEFVPSLDATAVSDIPHRLGTPPEFVLVWTEEFAGTTNNFGTKTMLGFVYMENLFGLPQRLSSSANCKGLTVNFLQDASAAVVSGALPTSGAYTQELHDRTDSVFAASSAGTNVYYRAGVTYKYFVSKAWWNVGGAENA
jgi:hypothetical protein